VAGKSSGTRPRSFATGLAVGGLAGLIAVDLTLMPALSIWGDASWLPVATAALFAVAWLTPLRRAAAALAVAAAALWLLVSFTPATRLLADGLVRRDPLRTADAVFVFASRVQSDGEPSTDAMSRLLKGLQLVSEGQAPRLVVSEMPRSRPYAAIAREWARDFAPRAEILVVGPVRNSRDEAVAVARLCRERGWKRVVAVTSPLHTRRAAAALEQGGLEVVSVPAVETRYDLETLDWPGDRRRGFAAALHERLGLFVYARRGWLEAGR
jgi:uncharacterized SAM-binding protein YcdF (DUF218 family)